MTEPAETFAQLDAAATAAIQLLGALADDTERRKLLYWEARKAGLPFPVEYDDAIGQVLDRLFVLNVLDFGALAALLTPADLQAERVRLLQEGLAAVEQAVARQARRPLRRRWR